MKSYNILIPQTSTKLKLYTPYKTLVIDYYRRIVIGDRGPYIEFETLIPDTVYIPLKQLWRTTNMKYGSAYYVEFRIKDASNVKIYGQLKRVNYADYLPGFYYISPYDLRNEHGNSIIE